MSPAALRTGSPLPGEIVQERVAGVGSALPIVSVAHTAKVWLPADRLVTVQGEEQGSAGPAPSTWHWNVDGSLAENVKLAKAFVVVPDGPVAMVVLGGVVSGAGMGGSPSRTPMLRQALVTEAVRVPVEPAAGCRAYDCVATAPTVFFLVDDPSAAASHPSVIP